MRPSPLPELVSLQAKKKVRSGRIKNHIVCQLTSVSSSVQPFGIQSHKVHAIQTFTGVWVRGGGRGGRIRPGRESVCSERMLTSTRSVIGKLKVAKCRVRIMQIAEEGKHRSVLYSGAENLRTIFCRCNRA